MLVKLSSLVTIREKKKGQLHKVFKDSFDAKPIITNPFLLQKINYIHNNPVTGKWMLAKDFIEYEHSSASFYELNKLQHFLPIHYMDILYWGLQLLFCGIDTILQQGFTEGF